MATPSVAAVPQIQDAMMNQNRGLGNLKRQSTGYSKVVCMRFTIAMSAFMITSILQCKMCSGDELRDSQKQETKFSLQVEIVTDGPNITRRFRTSDPNATCELEIMLAGPVPGGLSLLGGIRPNGNKFFRTQRKNCHLKDHERHGKGALAFVFTPEDSDFIFRYSQKARDNIHFTLRDQLGREHFSTFNTTHSLKHLGLSSKAVAPTFTGNTELGPVRLEFSRVATDADKNFDPRVNDKYFIETDLYSICSNPVNIKFLKREVRVCFSRDFKEEDHDWSHEPGRDLLTVIGTKTKSPLHMAAETRQEGNKMIFRGYHTARQGLIELPPPKDEQVGSFEAHLTKEGKVKHLELFHTDFNGKIEKVASDYFE